MFAMLAIAIAALLGQLRATEPITTRVEAVAVALPAPAVYKAIGEQAAAVALEQLGKRYVYATSGPNTFDCSGLTAFAWRSVGVEIPAYTVAQWRTFPHVPIAEVQVGDLVFSSSLGHVYLYIGDGQVVVAPDTGLRVRVEPLPKSGIKLEAVRPG